MKPKFSGGLSRLVRVGLIGLIGVTALALAGCSSLTPPPREQDVAQAGSGRISTTPVRNVTDFTDALRCMDRTFLRYNTFDVSVIMEDLADSTKKVSAMLGRGTR